MEIAKDEGKELPMMGDANVCGMKWEDPKYKHHRVARELKSGLDQKGLISMALVNTYLADNKSQD